MTLSWPYRLPLGAVVATCTLVDVVPMRGPGEVVGPCVYVPGPTSADFPDPTRLWGWQLPEACAGERHPYLPWVDLSSEMSHGDYSPGRYAWILADVNPIRQPVPVQGGQGLWTWDAVGSIPGGMKALSLYQPWASLIPLGAKSIETRPWTTRYRGPLAIHATKTIPPSLFDANRRLVIGDYEVERDNPRGTEPAYLLRNAA